MKDAKITKTNPTIYAKITKKTNKKCQGFFYWLFLPIFAAY